MSVGLFAFVAIIVTFTVCYTIHHNHIIDEMMNNNNKED